jgi:dTDP-6-deoxy-L-talose 4-dehydrogenase (NAD+)
MSGGKQLRDYLPVEKVAEYIVKISIDDKITGIINCCSGEPISIRKFVENYIAEKNKNIELNLGYYPYPDYEPMAFWGDNKKLMKILVKTDH